MTRLQLETYLVGPDLVSGRRGKVCAKIPLYVPGQVTLGAIPALAGPIAGSMRFLGTEPVDPINPADSDLALLPVSSNMALQDIADLLLLEACLGNWDEWDQTISQGRQDMGKFADRLQRELERLTTLCKSYGYGIGSPSLGSTDTGFAAISRWTTFGPPCP